MKSKVFALLILFFTAFSSLLCASEVTNGYVRLILNEKSGRFLIYYLSSPNSSRYEPLFSSENSATSYSSILVDGNVFRLGGRYFSHKFDNQSGEPGFEFKADDVVVTQVFTPIKTLNSEHANGILITYTIKNTSSLQSLIGLRILIDTDLGENRKNPFITSTDVVKNELLIEGNSGERFWISRGRNVSLMGSIINPVDTSAKVPDQIHFANWKRLNDTPWKLKYIKKRSFNNIPFSVKDSAVCYYFNPRRVYPGASITYSIVLSTEDVEWYNSIYIPPPPVITREKEIVKETETEKETSSVSVTVPIDGTMSPAERPRPILENYKEENTGEASSINIKQIELDALVEALDAGEDPNVFTLRKFQGILNQFIAGEIQLNEQDIDELEEAIGKYR